MNDESDKKVIRKPDRKTSVELTGLMMSQIIDENLMQRYGTSLQVNMGREYQKYLDEKYTKLKLEFDRINKDLDEGIDLDEMTSFLNIYEVEVKIFLYLIKSKKHFDKEYCRNLFNLLDKDRSGKISVYLSLLKLVKNL